MSENPWPNGVPEIMPAEDRAEIEELFARYAWGIDLADEEQAIATFAEDAEFDHLWQGKVRGHAAIRENLRKLWYDRQHWWYGRQHLMNHFIMDPLPEGARVRCFFQILQWNADYNTNFVFGIGTRDDRLVKRGGRWKFYPAARQRLDRGRPDPVEGRADAADAAAVQARAGRHAAVRRADEGWVVRGSRRSPAHRIECRSPAKAGAQSGKCGG